MGLVYLSTIHPLDHLSGSVQSVTQSTLVRGLYTYFFQGLLKSGVGDVSDVGRLRKVYSGICDTSSLFCKK